MSTCQQKQTPNRSRERTGIFEKVTDLARQCVDVGNSLMNDQKISEAIKKYDQAIEKCPYYAIPHYNKRIALSLQNDIPSNDIELKEKDINLLNKKFQDWNLTSQVDPHFVINIISVVPEPSEYDFSYDSSDEESDEEFNALYDEELVNDNNHYNDWPFTTRRHKKTELTFLEPTYFSYKNQDITVSKVVDPLLSKVLANGFELHDKDKLKNIAVSIGLNRMYSLSTRKNNSLILELESQVNTKEIEHEKFGYYWECSWYTKNGKETDFADVRKFYKQLKNKNSDLAKTFIEQEENQGAECNVPYQNIREYAKNHPKTKKLIQSFRDKDNAMLLYLHLVDADVLDFNGVYSAYLRIIAGCYKPPTVMSTGYEFHEESQNKAYSLLGHMERMHRMITTFHIPLGTYYPEPNMCIFIPQDRPTVDESFINTKRGKGKTLESPIILKNIQNNRQNVYAIFSEDNPIITNIPPRAKEYKKTKQSIRFSSEFHKGPAGPTPDDIKMYNKVSQSHTHGLTWSKGLFINNCIKYDNNYKTDVECIYGKNNRRLSELSVIKQCHHLISNIRKDVNVKCSQLELVKRIGKDNSDNIVNAIKDIKQFQKVFNTKYERTPIEQEFIDILDKCNLSYYNLSRKSLIMIATSQIMKLIKDNKINIQSIVDLDEEILEFICNSDQIIQALENKKVDLGDLIDLSRDHINNLSRESLIMIATSQLMQLIKDNKINIQSLFDLNEEILKIISNNDEIIQLLDRKDVDLDDLIDILRDRLNNFLSAVHQKFGIQTQLKY